MRVALKLTAVILGLLISVLALEGWLRVQHEREVFEHDLEHEQRLLGRALLPSVELAWRTEGAEAAERILSRAQRGESSEVRIRLVALEPGATGEAPAVASVAGSPLWRERSVVVREPAPGTVHTYVPVDSPEGRGTAIELSESLAAVEASLQRSLVRVLWTALAIIVGAGLIALLLGERVVGRPVRRLVAQAGRIEQGDLSPPDLPRRRDELGELKEAIAAMVAGLASARARLERETEARLEAERRLRHGERLAALGTLAAGVAHELGTPLQIVSGRARRIEDASDTAARACADAMIIRKQTKRMERIVRQLLALARPSDRARDGVDLAAVVGETLDLLGPGAAERHVRLERSLEDAEVEGDRDHLGQLATNLVRNAIQAVEPGAAVRVRLFTTGDATSPAGAPHDADRFVCLEVADEGPGISPDVQLHVFDPFFTTKEVGEGTGLGLSIAHGIARDHGGWIELSSQAGEGAVFRVCLPARPVT